MPWKMLINVSLGLAPILWMKVDERENIMKNLATRIFKKVESKINSKKIYHCKFQ